MRLALVVPVTALLAGLAPGAQAEPPRERVLATKARWAGAHPFCVSSACQLKIQVRAGEQYLHLLGSSGTTSPAFDVMTTAGPVRVCVSTKAGPLPIAGLDSVVLRVVHDPVCGLPSLEGTLVAYFAERPVTLGEAMEYAAPDPDRMVAGGA